MKKFLKTFWPYLAVLLLWTAVAMFLYPLVGCDRGLKKEIEQLREELAKQQQYVPLQREKIRDTVEVVTQKIYEVEKVKEALTKEDKELLKDLNVKVSAIESFQKMSTVTEAEVTLSPSNEAEDSGSSQQDSILSYKDAWIDLQYNNNNRKIVIALQDSLTIAVNKEYKKKFLWWRWGVKGYQVKAMSLCPYTTIKYNTYVKRRK